MNGNDFITVAGRWAAGRSPDEATCRSAVSRAYYGVFHLATEFLNELDVHVGTDHGKVRAYLFASGTPDAVEASRLLGDLQNSRIKADYRIKKSIANTPIEAKFAVEQAAKAANHIRNCSQDPTRAQLKARVLEYRQKLGE